MPSRASARTTASRGSTPTRRGLNERRRDEAVAAALGEADVEWTLHQGGTLLPPGSVLTGKGECYRVYTPYARACREAAQRAAGGGRRAPSADAAGLGRGPAAGPLRRLRPALGRGARALARRRGCRRRAAGRLCRRGHRVLPGRPRLPRRDPARVACRPIWPPACCRPASCARRRRRTWASWTAARPASPPGSMNCCGASSTSTCWPPIPNCRCTGP